MATGQANSTTASTSTAAPIGRTGQATAERACRPLLAERLDHQVRAAVHDFGNIDEIFCRADEAAKLHHARHTLKVAQRRPHLRDQVNGADARRC